MMITSLDAELGNKYQHVQHTASNRNREGKGEREKEIDELVDMDMDKIIVIREKNEYLSLHKNIESMEIVFGRIEKI